MGMSTGALEGGRGQCLENLEGVEDVGRLVGGVESWLGPLVRY